jgi:hypothetical protein
VDSTPPYLSALRARTDDAVSTVWLTAGVWQEILPPSNPASTIARQVNCAPRIQIKSGQNLGSVNVLDEQLAGSYLEVFSQKIKILSAVLQRQEAEVSRNSSAGYAAATFVILPWVKTGTPQEKKER